jgi:hypothetical protein
VPPNLPTSPPPRRHLSGCGLPTRPQGRWRRGSPTAIHLPSSSFSPLSSARSRPRRRHLRLWWPDPLMPSLNLHPAPPDLPFWRLSGSGCGGDGGARFLTPGGSRCSGGSGARVPAAVTGAVQCGNLPGSVCGWARGWAWLRQPGRVRPGWTCERTCGDGTANGGGGVGACCSMVSPFFSLSVGCTCVTTPVVGALDP